MNNEEALAKISEDGELEFALDSVASTYTTEIDTIYKSIRDAEGIEVTRLVWASDMSMIGDVLLNENFEETLEKAARELGISLNVSDLFIDAARRLREK